MKQLMPDGKREQKALGTEQKKEHLPANRQGITEACFKIKKQPEQIALYQHIKTDLKCIGAQCLTVAFERTGIYGGRKSTGINNGLFQRDGKDRNGRWIKNGADPNRSSSL